MPVGSTPLLDVLNQRWDTELSKAPDPTPEKPFKRPVYASGAQQMIDRTSRLHAEANASDPFAWSRCRHYLRQGLTTIGDVEKDARQQLSARKAQGVTFAAVMK